MNTEAGFTYLFSRCAGSVCFTAFLLCGNWHEAKDMMQSALWTLYLAEPS